MNILFLSELFHPHGGGAELATYLYAKLLGEADCNVFVVTNKFGKEPKVSKNGSLTIYRLPLFRKSGRVKFSVFKRFDVLFSSFMKKLMKWADVTCIPRFWYSAIPLAKAYGKPVITHLHDYFPICSLSNAYDVSKDAVCNCNSLLCPQKCIYVYEKTQGRGLTETLTSTALNSTLGRCFGKFARLSDAVICVSKVQKEMVAKGEPSLRDRTSVIYNPLPRLSYIKMQGDDFGYFGGRNYLKGFNTLFHALIHVRRTNPKLTKIHATKFSDSSKGLAESLSKLGILSYGKLKNDEYTRVYKQIRAVIVPSIWHEPWPYVVVEAIIRGRLVIASRVGGIPEQVEGCKSASLCEPGNPEQLAKALELVGSLNREEIAELGLQCKEKFSKRFDNETSIRRFISICEKLI